MQYWSVGGADLNPLPAIPAAEVSPERKLIARALSRLVLMGASEGDDLWHAIDRVAANHHKQVERLNLELKIARATKPEARAA